MVATNKKSPQMLLPKESIKTHPIILDMAYRKWALRDFEGFPPDPDELMQQDLDYYDEVLTYSLVVKVYQDESKRES